ncbi:MAG: hypothetical protein MK135_15595 [Polyangiaceae bacterium]|nr:hypothetical protein [Polyangiaceae bacterium]
MRTPLLTVTFISLLCITGCQQTSESPSPTKGASGLRASEGVQTQPKKASAPSADSQRQPAAASKVELHAPLAESVKDILPMMDQISPDRKKQLKKLALFIETKKKSGEEADLTFICTHNSRRSHLSQLWSATAAAYYGVQGVKTYSGGTESTAFNPRAVAAVERAGFQVEKPEGENPHYLVSFGPQAQKQECYSKKYNDAKNPQKNFAAIMTCSQADKNCPTVEGAVLRVPIPYVDPKEADGTPKEAATYDERSRQIASEMFYLFSQVHS